MNQVALHTIYNCHGFKPEAVIAAIDKVRREAAAARFVSLSVTEEWWRSEIGLAAFRAAEFAYGDLITLREAAALIGVSESRMNVATNATKQRPAIIAAFCKPTSEIRTWTQRSPLSMRIRKWLDAHPEALEQPITVLQKRMQVDFKAPRPPAREWVGAALKERRAVGGIWYASKAEILANVEAIRAIKPGP